MAFEKQHNVTGICTCISFNMGNVCGVVLDSPFQEDMTDWTLEYLPLQCQELEQCCILVQESK